MNKLKKLLISGTTGVVMLGIATAAFAVTNGSFENGTPPGSFSTVNSGDSTTLTGWTVDTGSVDYIGSYWQPSNGDRSIDLNGNQAGSISQTFPTSIGATYQVTFDVSGNPDGEPSFKTGTVTATGATPQIFDYTTGANSKEDMMWEPNTYTFVATATTTTLTFASTISGAYGPALDNVVVTETIPTPPAECTGTYTNFIEGTNNSEVITGTPGNDLIIAMGGNDHVDGLGGQDCIVGGDGNDLLLGSNGADIILGGLGNDDISGGNAADTLYGNEGNDHITGGDDADKLYGGDGNDGLFGDAGADTIDGNLGNDVANGGTQTDTCTAEAKISCP